jgi:hypothetical protein
MMISIRYRFIFIHIAKTGGTSLREALRRQTWRDPYRIPQALCSRISGLFGHRLGCKIPRHARAVAAREMLPRELFDRCFKFAFVRNPWDLQVSSYHHIRRERPRLMTAAGIGDFESFLRWKLDGNRPYHYIVDTSIQQQADYLVDLHGKTIVDFIGRYERLESDFGEICSRIGIPTPRLPHKRRAIGRRHYRDCYTGDTRRLVAEYFRTDIERFGYTF